VYPQSTPSPTHDHAASSRKPPGGPADTQSGQDHDDRGARSRAQRTLLAVATLGTATQGLFWDAGVGVNLLAWVALICAAVFVGFGRGRRVPPMAMLAGGLALLFASEFVLYRGPFGTLAGVFAVGLVLFLPLLTDEQTRLNALPGVPLRVLLRMLRIPDALVFMARLAPAAASGGARPAVVALAKGLLLGGPIALVFVMLFSADPAFARALSTIDAKLGTALFFGAFSLATSIFYLFVYGLRLPGAGSDMPLPPYVHPYRVDAPAIDAHATRRAWLGAGAWLAVIVQVALVFALFVGVNARQLFGGHLFVRAAGAPTYAEYLHAGFAQLLVAAGLSSALVAIGHGLVRRHAHDGAASRRALVVAEVVLLALTGVTLASCAQRLAIYEEAYGVTHLRFGVRIVLVQVALVIVLTLVKSMAKSFSAYGGAVVVSLVGVLALACAVNVDARLAEATFDRAMEGKLNDLYYVYELGPDACGALEHPYLQNDPDLRRSVRDAWNRPPPADFRAFRGMVRCR
jgi:hypothetical protein